MNFKEAVELAIRGIKVMLDMNKHRKHYFGGTIFLDINCPESFANLHEEMIASDQWERVPSDMDVYMSCF